MKDQHGYLSADLAITLSLMVALFSATLPVLQEQLYSYQQASSIQNNINNIFLLAKKELSYSIFQRSDFTELDKILINIKKDNKYINDYLSYNIRFRHRKNNFIPIGIEIVVVPDPNADLENILFSLKPEKITQHDGKSKENVKTKEFIFFFPLNFDVSNWSRWDRRSGSFQKNDGDKF